MNGTFIKFTLLIIFCFPFNLNRIFAQAEPLHGSFILAAVGKDGIIIAADSRCAIVYSYGGKKKHLGYFDIVPKIYEFKRCAFATGGNFQIENLFLNKIVKDFKTSVNEDTISVNNLLSSFFIYCREKYAASFYQKILTDVYVSGGYVGGEAKIIGYNPLEKRLIVLPENNFFATGESNFVNQYSKYDSCTILANKAEIAIIDYANSNSKTETIGGIISVLKITKDKISYIKNPPPPFPWIYYNDFANDYFKNKVPIVFNPPIKENKETFERIFISKYIKK